MPFMLRLFRTVPLLLAAACRTAPDPPAVPLYDNLGTHHYRIGTADSLVQRYFNQGLRLYYAFNHAEAIRAFEEAGRRDPTCAMCRWGVALALGPNINAAMDSAAGAAAWAAIREAQARAAGAGDRERALIDALAARYAAVPPADRSALDSAWAAAIGAVAARFPDDLEIATLHAEALMDLSPWNYWNADGTPRPDTPRILATLERVMAADAVHPGAHHFYIHAVEAVEPQRAIAVAERLAGLMPGAGHLVHMPSHIYIRVGRYADAVAINEHATHADETWIRDQRPGPGFYLAAYYPHNYDFLAFAASMLGRKAQTLDAADRDAAAVPRELLGAPGYTLLQHHLTKRLQARVRFAAWAELLAEPKPADTLRHAVGMWHYARGRALAATGKVAAAATELAALRALATDGALAGQRMEYNSSDAVLGVASEVLAGFVAQASGDPASAVAHLEAAVRQEDALTYGEPPEWTVPPRQELGAVLLAAGRARDAERAFRGDLAKFPENGWSLRGLAAALRALGKAAEAADVESRFRKAWATADR
ncbi:MAG: hypothetical protein KJT01_05445 [Gemmatimonadetes bacterium]|nr:hypothetical protein [Gemmatimonadota bacterium]